MRPFYYQGREDQTASLVTKCTNSFLGGRFQGGGANEARQSPFAFRPPLMSMVAFMRSPAGRLLSKVVPSDGCILAVRDLIACGQAYWDSLGS